MKVTKQEKKEIDPAQIKANIQYLKNCQAMLEDLPDTMIKARDEAKISQRELGEELGVKREQVTADEGEKYQNSATHKVRRALNATIKLLEQKIEN